MNRAGFFETFVGLIVVAAAAAFLVYAYSVSGRDLTRGGYELSAVFGRVDGVAVGSEVRIAGVKVGAVSAQALDRSTYEARLTLAIAGDVPVPEDSVAKIVSDGVLGGAHVAIEPGAAEGTESEDKTAEVPGESAVPESEAEKAATDETEGSDDASADVVSLDAFRKK